MTSRCCYERSVVDTPQADRTLTSSELLALSGMDLAVGADVSGAPYTSGDAVALAAWQYSDGTKLAAEVTYDNFEERTYKVPQAGIERAVRLTWPAPAGVNYAVESAPTVQGPWLPVSELEMPGMKQMTVPAGGLSQFFRLRQAP